MSSIDGTTTIQDVHELIVSSKLKDVVTSAMHGLSSSTVKGEKTMQDIQDMEKLGELIGVINNIATSVKTNPVKLMAWGIKET